jgi:branched-chain amino acid transport system permease protein
MVQVFVNSLDSAAIYLLVALGFSLIYRVTRFFHFAHAASFTAGAYAVFFFLRVCHWPLAFAIFGALAASALLGCVMELAVYRPLRRRGAPSTVLLISSLGLYIVLQNAVSLIFGDDLKSVRPMETEEGIALLGANITPAQILTICTSVLLVLALAMALRTLRIGKLIRAVANDPQLAHALGIDTGRIILLAFAVGSLMGGIAGILVALEIDLTPTMGMDVFMMAVVAVIIGGVSSAPGVVLGSLILGGARHYSIWLFSPQWQDAIAFALLLIVLWLRPQGIFGGRSRRVSLY